MNMLITVSTRSLILTSFSSSVYMVVKSHNIALRSYPSPQVWEKMSLVSKNAEYTRHLWLIGSGFVLGSLIIPSLVL